MSADDTRLALLSHELRAPAGVIAGYLKLLAREPALTERQQTIIASALAAGDKIHTLLQELIDLLQLEAGELKCERRPVPLQVLVADLAVAAAAWPETPSLHLGAVPNVVLQADRPRLTAALSALARAAARPLGQAATVRINGALDESAGLRLVLSSAEDLPDVPPVPLDESRSGLGLALPLACAVVSAHGGAVTEQRTPTGAVAFTVVLPPPTPGDSLY